MTKKIELPEEVMSDLYDEVSKAMVYQGRNIKPRGIRKVSEIINEFCEKNEVAEHWVKYRLNKQSWYKPYLEH